MRRLIQAQGAEVIHLGHNISATTGVSTISCELPSRKTRTV
jgi:hypothetical protein